MRRASTAFLLAVALLGSIMADSAHAEAITTAPALVTGVHVMKDSLHAYLDQKTSCKEGDAYMLVFLLSHPAAIYWKTLLLTAQTLKRHVVVSELYCQPANITLQ